MHLRLSHLTRLLLLSLCVALPAAARVISYAPYTNKAAIPAVQHRLNRHFALFEVGSGVTNPIFVPYMLPQGQVVIYDSTGIDEPRVVFPPNGEPAQIMELAVRQSEGQQPVILLRTNHNYLGSNPAREAIFLISPDGGVTWKRAALSATASLYGWLMPSNDVGGPIVRGRHAQIRIGTEANPFVVGFEGATGVFAVRPDGITRKIAQPESDVASPLLGTNSDGSVMIVRTARDKFTVVTTDSAILDPQPGPTTLVEPDFQYEAWMTPFGSIYFEGEGARLFIYRNGGAEKIVNIETYGSILLTPPVPQEVFFAIPTSDYAGAWFVRGNQISTSGGTSLWLHFNYSLVKQWEDISRPQIEALHAGMSNRTLLIQVHRPRTMADQRLFLDPALAVWHAGGPAPKAYDELFMNEQYTKGFVHVDVDKLEEGEPFVFDSGAIMPTGGVIVSPPPPPSAGGGDVIQEWGVVRASLKQKLVLPGIGRVRGGYDSNWVSDVILQNPLATQQKVSIRFAENGAPAVGASVFNSTTVTLQPYEIRVVRDALKELFAIENGNGAFFLTPESGINANSRTYNKTSAGTYGYNLNAIDLYNAASPRFPVSFSGAFPGSNFRTNVVITDASTAGTQAQLSASGTSGSIGADGILFDAPAGGQFQANNVGATLRLDSHDSGALVVTPRRGFAIASVFSIDNRTNDPTYFPPDLPAPIVRTIPVIGHIAGANNSEFRSDLYLFNPASTTNTVTLQVKSWDTAETPVTLNLTLLPREGRVIRDVLKTAFNKTGLARLRYTSQSNTIEGVRVTSRTYTVNLETGGTFGFLMPPLNNFQHAGPGDTLEILGPVHDATFRTNLGVVDMAAFANASQATTVKIEIVGSGNRVVDRFDIAIPSAGGLQLNDLLRARNLVPDGNPYLLRISPVNGIVGAFASIIDNGTNDPSYVAANLAAQQ